MKGKNHLFVNLIILIILCFLVGFICVNLNFNPFLIFSLSILFIIFFVFLFLVGAILPDSDSYDKGSLIYVLVPRTVKQSINNSYDKSTGNGIFSIFLLAFAIIAYPMGHITNILEKKMMEYTKRKRGHRESLHTIFGISLVSLFWAFIFYFAYSLLSRSFNLYAFFLFLMALFVSQLLHLIEDLNGIWTISLK